MRKLPVTILTLLLLALAACQSAAPAAAPASPTTAAPIINTAVPPTNTALPAPVVEAAAEEPTLPPPATATNSPPTEPPPTTVPTETPVPASLVSQISLEPIITRGLLQPLYLTHANDNRLFIVEQAGTIRIFQDGALRESPFLAIEDIVGSSSNEQGLLGLAFHPNYAENGTFFLNYTDNNGRTNIARYRVSSDPNVADPGSGEILLTVPQPFANHNGGMIAFGPDGYLYVGLGDGGSQGDPQGHGQNPATLLGSILRLDVDSADGIYTIPADNPFAPGANIRPEVWAFGFRNPWRFSFDRLNGDLYVADVGQNTWEEVSWQAGGTPGGQNFGWNRLEGNHCFTAGCDPADFTPAVFEYDHSQGCSITGGYVYRGQQFPSLNGNYFTADFCSGLIWGIFQQPDGTWQSTIVSESGLPITSFGEDAQGELYVVARTGQVMQIQASD